MVRRETAVTLPRGADSFNLFVAVDENEIREILEYISRRLCNCFLHAVFMMDRANSWHTVYTCYVEYETEYYLLYCIRFIIFCCNSTTICQRNSSIILFLNV